MLHSVITRVIEEGDEVEYTLWVRGEARQVNVRLEGTRGPLHWTAFWSHTIVDLCSSGSDACLTGRVRLDGWSRVRLMVELPFGEPILVRGEVHKVEEGEAPGLPLTWNY